MWCRKLFISVADGEVQPLTVARAALDARNPDDIVSDRIRY